MRTGSSAGRRQGERQGLPTLNDHLHAPCGWPFVFSLHADDGGPKLLDLDMLYRHCEKAEYTCRFHWRSGPVAFWDNRATLHYALDDYGDAVRKAHRVTLRGDKPFGPGDAKELNRRRQARTTACHTYAVGTAPTTLLTCTPRPGKEPSASDASPNANTPPSEPMSQYPRPSGVGTMATTLETFTPKPGSDP